MATAAGHPDGDYHTERYAEDLIDVAATLPGRPALIGASLGGIAGMMVEALLAPGTFDSLTLVDIIPRADPTGVDKIMGFMGAQSGAGVSQPGGGGGERSPPICRTGRGPRTSRGCARTFVRALTAVTAGIGTRSSSAACGVTGRRPTVKISKPGAARSIFLCT